MEAASILQGLSADNGKFERDFEQIEKISRGGFGSVYRARHKMDRQVYAVKKTVLKAPSGNPLLVREELKKMLKEVRLFAAINDTHVIRYNHSWIEMGAAQGAEKNSILSPDPQLSGDREQIPEVELVTSFLEFARPESSSSHSSAGASSQNSGTLHVSPYSFKIILFIQMELCKKTLQEHLIVLNSSHPSFADREGYAKRLDIAFQVVKALRIVHRDHKLIHRDLSLNNVFIGKDEVVKIGDFGLATKCHSLVPEKSSPFSLRPISDPDEGALAADQFQLCSPAVEPQEEECAVELTHGLGTKSFASPEQMSDAPYDQRSDIYSLGLVFMVLFYPTVTISERLMVLKNCRNNGPPKDFAAVYPLLAELISRMVRTGPWERPSIDEIEGSEVFRLLRQGVRMERAYSAPVEEVERHFPVQMKMGREGPWKEKFLRISKESLFVYHSAYDSKARLCYSTKESRILPLQRACVSQVESARPDAPFACARTKSVDASESAEPSSVYAMVEHADLETLYLKLDLPQFDKLAKHFEFARGLPASQ